LWLIKVWFFATIFVVKGATFAKPENVRCNFTEKSSQHIRHKPITYYKIEPNKLKEQREE
jgi:hypothetical protein